jgi:hypothetical protein
MFMRAAGPQTYASAAAGESSPTSQSPVTRCRWWPLPTRPPLLLATIRTGSRAHPLQAGARWVVERVRSWHTRGFRKLLICTERRIRVIDAFISLANAVINIRRLLRTAWTTHRWDTRSTRRPELSASSAEPLAGGLAQSGSQV